MWRYLLFMMIPVMLAGLPASAATVTWISDSDGEWSTGANWDTGTPPSTGDDVVISREGVTVTVSVSGNHSISTLRCDEALHLVSGSLTLTASSTIEGPVTAQSGALLTAQGDGVLVTLAGNTATEALGLTARLGAVIELPGVTEASGSPSGEVTWRADHAGSRIAAPLLTSIALTNTANFWFMATAGGVVDLSAVTEITAGRFQLYADGLNSLVDLGGVGVLETPGPVNSRIQIYNNGEIRVSPELKSLRQVDVHLLEGSLFPIEQLEAFGNGAITVQGRDALLANLTVLEDASLSARQGAQLDLPLVETYRGGSQSRAWAAHTAPARINLPALESLDLSSAVTTMTLQASVGAEVLLPVLAEVIEGRLGVLSEGTNSLVDLSALAGLSGPASSTHYMVVSGGGTVQIAPEFTQFDQVSLTFQNGAAFPFAQIESFGNATLTVHNMEVELGGLTQLEAVNFSVAQGGQLSLPLITAHALSPEVSTYWACSGAGSTLSFPALQTLQLSSTSNLSWSVNSNSQVLLPLLDTVTPGRLFASADGAGSLIDLSALASFTGGGGGPSRFSASAGAEVRLAAGFDRLILTDLWLVSGGIFPLTQLVRLEEMTVSITGQDAVFPNVTAMLDSSIYTYTSGKVTFPALARYETTRSGSRVFQASGAGSEIHLPVLSELALSMEGFLHIYALSGGFVDLPQITALDSGRFSIQSSGANSRIDLSALLVVDAPQPHFSDVRVENGGSITIAPGLDSLNNVNLYLSGEGALATRQLRSFRNGTLFVQSGANLILENLEELESATLYVYTGSSLELPAVTAISSGNATQIWQVQGPNAILRLPALTVLGGPETALMYIDARGGGLLDLPSLTSVQRGRVFFSSAQADSLLRMPMLTDITYESTSRNTFAAQDGGEIQLSPQLTTLQKVDLNIHHGGLLPVGQFEQIVDSDVQIINSNVSFDGLATLSDMNLYVFGGGVALLPVLSEAGNTRPGVWQAYNAGSRIESASLLDWTLSETGAWMVQAWNGGQVLLPNLEALGPGQATFTASNLDSLVDLERLVRYDSEGVRFQELDGGVILMTFYPNLMVSSANGAPNATAGQPYNVSWMIENTGLGTVEGVVETCAYLSPNTTLEAGDPRAGCSAATLSLPQGGNSEQSATFTLPLVPTGNYYLLLHVDDDGNWVENREDDNVRAIGPIAVTGTGTEGEGEGEGEPPFECPDDCALPGVDTDGDGLTDDCEIFCTGTDPLLADTDGDGMPDGWEVQYGLDPLDPSDRDLDPDGDALSNLEEFLKDSSPIDPNSPAQSFFVAPPPLGVDALPGGNPDAPWATIGFALDNIAPSAAAPVRVILSEGSYREDLPLALPPHTTIAAALDAEVFIMGSVFGGENSGLEGVNLSSTEETVVLLDLSGPLGAGVRMTISGVGFHGDGGTGIHMQGPGSAGTVIESCLFHGLGHGIVIAGPLPTLRRTFFEHLSGPAILVAGEDAPGIAAPKGLGDATDPANGWNTFDLGTIDGAAIVNEGEGELKLEENDWLTDDPDEIAAAMEGEVDFLPFLPKGTGILAASVFCTVWEMETQNKILHGAVDLQISGYQPVTENSSGVYAFPAIADGNYSVTASASGFSALRQNVTVTPGGVHSLIFSLPRSGGGEGEGEGENPRPPCCRRPNGRALPEPSDLAVGALALCALWSLGRRRSG